MVNLQIKLLQHFMKKLNRGKAKAAGKVIPEDDSIVLTERRNRLALLKLSPTLRNTAIFLELRDHFLVMSEGPKS